MFYIYSSDNTETFITDLVNDQIKSGASAISRQVVERWVFPGGNIVLEHLSKFL